MQLNWIPRHRQRGVTPPGRAPHRWHWTAAAAAAATLTTTLTAAAPGAAADGAAKSPGSAKPGPGPVSCGPPHVAPPVLCYRPHEYQVAYGAAALIGQGIDGRGEAVAMPELANAPSHGGIIFTDIRRAYPRAFHDVVTGDNSVMLPSRVLVGYQAGPGWDPVTGWGSPNAQALVPLLAHDARPGGAHS